MTTRLLCGLLLLVTVAVSAQESHTLTTPVTPPSVATYTIRSILLDWQNRAVEISVIDNAGVITTKTYNATTTPTGQSLMVLLNKADLRTNTLNMRALNRLVMDGVIGPGTPTGTIP